MDDEVAVATPEPQAAAPAPDPSPTPVDRVDEAPDPASMQAKIEELRKSAKEAEEKALYWRRQKAEARADYFRREPPAAQPQEPAGIGPEPTPAQFDDYQKYTDAKIQHEVRKARLGWEQDNARRQQDEQARAKIVTMNERISRGFQKYQDFEDVVMDDSLPISPVVANVLAESEIPEDVAYYLGKNRSEAIRLSRLNSIQAAREIARIEMQLSANPGSAPQPTPKKITSAPPPIRPLGASNTVSKDPEKMSQKEYEAWRKAQGARPF